MHFEIPKTKEVPDWYEKIRRRIKNHYVGLTMNDSRYLPMDLPEWYLSVNSAHPLETSFPVDIRFVKLGEALPFESFSGYSSETSLFLTTYPSIGTEKRVVETGVSYVGWPGRTKRFNTVDEEVMMGNNPICAIVAWQSIIRQANVIETIRLYIPEGRMVHPFWKELWELSR